MKILKICGIVKNMQKTDKENRFELLLTNIKKKFSGIFNFFDRIVKMLIIVILMFLILEILSFGILKGPIFLGKYLGVDYFNSDLQKDVFLNKEWVPQYYKETILVDSREYASYLEFKRTGNFSGTYINLDENSHRFTDNPCKGKEAIKIFVFGGSTTWGTGARDNYTIPSYISKKLCEDNISVEVTNFGEAAYVNTQEMISLQLELRKGNIPDYVIFYDGINDVYSAYQEEAAGYPQNIANRKFEYGLRDKFNIIRPIFNGNFVTLLRETMHYFSPKETKKIDNSDELSDEVIDIYFGNKRIIDGLGKEYNFTVFYFWQPTIFTKRQLSENEKSFDPKIDENFALEVYSKIKLYNNSDNFYDISDIFEDINDSVYVDFCHISEEGNEMIADRIVNVIKEDIQK